MNKTKTINNNKIINFKGVQIQKEEYEQRLKILEVRFLDSLNDGNLTNITPTRIEQTLYLSKLISELQDCIARLQRVLE